MTAIDTDAPTRRPLALAPEIGRAGDLVRLEVSDIVIDVLTGIYSEETHMPQPLRISVSADIAAPRRYESDTPLTASKNYMDLRRAIEELPRDVHFNLVEAVADHIADTLFGGDERVTRVEVKIVKLALSQASESIGDEPGADARLMLALITGGLSKLGSVIAARLAAEGYDLALHTRDGRADERLAARIAGARTWAIFPAELADAAAVEGLVGRVATHFGRSPTCLVNSASMWSEDGWADAGVETLVTHFRINVAAPIALAGALAASLAPGATGVVINILDQRIVNPPADQAAYTLSKLSLAAATRTMARALAPQLRVNGVAPGLTVPGQEYDPGQVSRLAERMPLGRLPEPEEIADAIAYLARAKAVTGQIVFVDGGAALESYPRDFVHMDR